MGRTYTTHHKSFTRPGNVTYTFDASENPLKATTITLPPASPWTSGLHWHETHTEYLQVIQGVARVKLSGITRNHTSADGIIVVPRFARHEWQRADDPQPHPDGIAGGLHADIDLIVKEWTDPADGQKEVFFRNLNSVILDASATGPLDRFWLTLQLFMIFATLDNYPVFYRGPRSLWLLAPVLEWVVTHAALFSAILVGRVCGLRAIYDAYTPNRLRWQIETSKMRVD